VYWWNSREGFPDDVSGEQVLLELNRDFSARGLTSQDLQAVVAAWQAGAISRIQYMGWSGGGRFCRRGEILPEGRTSEEEKRLIGGSGTPI
jgi:hypothetical protein